MRYVKKQKSTSVLEEPSVNERVKDAKEMFEEEKEERDDDYSEVLKLNQSIEQEDNRSKNTLWMTIGNSDDGEGDKKD